jgi:hypothetical protein
MISMNSFPDGGQRDPRSQDGAELSPSSIETEEKVLGSDGGYGQPRPPLGQDDVRRA